MYNLWHILIVFWTFLIGAWRPVVEILILTVGIYSALRFVRGTRGAPVVMGFLVVLLALVLTSFLLKLKVLQYLLGAFYAFFLLAVLVIFQPELRRMLAELGNLPLLATVREQRENIEVIVQTVERLADVRIGALIAIERSIHLPAGRRIGDHRRLRGHARDARDHLLPQQRHPRRGRHHPGRPDCLCGVHLSPDPTPGFEPVPGHPAPCGHRVERRDRCRRGGRLRGDRRHFLRLKRPPGPQRHSRGTPGFSDLDIRNPRPLAHLDRLDPVLDHRESETGAHPCGAG